jgi:hypothetical protein
MPNCGKATELIPLYIENELTEEERVWIEEHLASCESCKAYYEDMCSLMSTLYSIEDEAPPEGLHDEFMDKLRKQVKPGPAFMSWNYKIITQAAACAAVALIAVSALFAGVSALFGFSNLSNQADQNDSVAAEQAQFKLDAPVKTGGGAVFEVQLDQYSIDGDSSAVEESPSAEIYADIDADSAEQQAASAASANEDRRDLPWDPIAASITHYNIELTVDDIKQIMGEISRLSGVQVNMSYSAPASEGDRGSASITRRVSAQEFETVKERLRSLGAVTNESESKESRSRQLLDLKAKLTAKDAEKDRLLNLLGMSGELDVMVRVESRLNRAADESDSLNAEIRDINNEIGQPYLNIQLYNRIYAQPAPPKQGLGVRMANSFKQSINGVLGFMQNLLLFVASTVVPLSVCAVFAILIFMLFRHWVKKRRGGRMQ